jgi:hypothetical protein
MSGWRRGRMYPARRVRIGTVFFERSTFTAADLPPDEATAPRAQAPGRDRAYQTSLQGSEIEPRQPDGLDRLIGMQRATRLVYFEK